jgi:hypothetical protein
MNLSESDREVVINYIARERAETWVINARDGSFAASGLARFDGKDEEFFYNLARKGPNPPDWATYDVIALEERTDQELFEVYLYFYCVDPQEHMMDLFVASKIVAEALAFA